MSSTTDFAKRLLIDGLKYELSRLELAGINPEKWAGVRNLSVKASFTDMPKAVVTDCYNMLGYLVSFINTIRHFEKREDFNTGLGYAQGVLDTLKAIFAKNANWPAKAVCEVEEVIASYLEPDPAAQTMGKFIRCVTAMDEVIASELELTELDIDLISQSSICDTGSDVGFGLLTENGEEVMRVARDLYAATKGLFPSKREEALAELDRRQLQWADKASYPARVIQQCLLLLR